MAVAVPAGVAVWGEGADTDIVLAPAADGVLPRLQPDDVPAGFDLTEIVERPALADLQPVEDHVQVLRLAGRDDRVVARQSSLPPERLVPPQDATEVDVNGARAWLVRRDANRASLTWVDEQTQVVRELYARGLSDAELSELATVLRRRSDGPGFDLDALPVGVIATDEGELPAEDDLGDTPRRDLRWDREEGDGVIKLTVREGSALELDLLRATAAQVALMRIGGTDRLLVTTETDEGPENSVHWSEGEGVVVEVSATGLSRGELIDFVDELRPVGEDDWAGLIQAAGGSSVGVIPPAEAGADADGVADEGPGYAVEGVTSGVAWRLSWPPLTGGVGGDGGSADEADQPGSPSGTGPDGAEAPACVTLTVGATEAVHCPDGDGAGVVAFEAGDLVALVAIAPGDRPTALVTANGEIAFDAALGEVAISWSASSGVSATATLSTMAAGPVEVEIRSPRPLDEATGAAIAVPRPGRDTQLDGPTEGPAAGGSS